MCVPGNRQARLTSFAWFHVDDGGLILSPNSAKHILLCLCHKAPVAVVIRCLTDLAHSFSVFVLPISSSILGPLLRTSPSEKSHSTDIKMKKQHGIVTEPC